MPFWLKFHFTPCLKELSKLFSSGEAIIFVNYDLNLVVVLLLQAQIFVFELDLLLNAMMFTALELKLLNWILIKEVLCGSSSKDGKTSFRMK